jgi:hypothetical protein
MTKPTNFKPFINPDLDLDRAVDQLKYLFYELSPIIARLQLALAEAGGTGKMDPDESERQQGHLITLWETLYINTLSFTRDDAHDNGVEPDSDECPSGSRSAVTPGSVIRCPARVRRLPRGQTSSSSGPCSCSLSGL